MTRRLLIGMVLTGAMIAGCQAAPAAEKPAATSQTAPAPQAASYSHARAVVLYRAAKYQEDETMCKAALAAIEKTGGPKSRDVAEPLDDLATVYLREAKFGDAKPLIERAESVLDKNTPADAILLGRIAINKGWRLYALEQVGAAEKVFEEGRALLEKNQKLESVELAELINNLGLTYADSDDPDAPPDAKRVAKARALLFKSWEMRRRLTGDISAETGESLNNIGMHLLYHGEGEEDVELGLSTLKKALAVSENVYGADHPETAVSHANLAAALHLTEDNDAAEAEVNKAIPMTEKAFGKDHLDRSYELQLLGAIEQADGKFPQAEASLKEAVRILEVTFGKDHPNVASGLEGLRDLYEAMGDEAREKAVILRIDRIRGKDI